MKRVVFLIVTFAIGTVLLYLSRFWLFDLWPRSGLFGIQDLRPGGDLLSRWLRGTPFAQFELLIWAVGGFLALTALERLFALFNPPPPPPAEEPTHDD